MVLERHPWSQGFEWVDHVGPFSFLTPEQVRQFDTDGYTVVPRLLDEIELTGVRTEIDRFDAEFDARLSESDQPAGMSEKGAMSFIPNLVARSPLLAQFVRHPTLLAIAADLLGPDVDLYWDQAVYKRPERPQRFPLHQDTGYQLTEPEDFLSCWIALTDATPENGCLMLAPGLHRHGTLRHVHVEPQGWEECLLDSPPELVAAPLPAGGAVVFSSLTPHTTEANTTDGIRKGYLILYARPGTVVYAGSPDEPRPEPQPQNDPRFQFPVLRGGRPVS
jgi:ectoine hydroxylase-related dioxygenase (phytanoyl-CoA dioxygenase family)